MVELSRSDAGWSLGAGGDTLNTALHLVRSGNDVSFLTALGADPLSRAMVERWEAEGLNCDLVLTHPTRQPGLYAVETDRFGERAFMYWRKGSAASAMFEIAGIEAAFEKARGADLFAFSLISLAILPSEHRHRMIELAQAVRSHGGLVAFDGNYRPSLWSDAAEAVEWRDAAIAVSAIGLPTLEDERLLSGAADADEVASYWQSRGCPETIVKLGGDGCRLPNASRSPVPSLLVPTDTSGAGDAFNAGYLAARLRGMKWQEAAEQGHRLAAWTVMRRGAIPQSDDAAPY